MYALVNLSFVTVFLQTLNYGLTKSYLDLIVTYATLMMLVARVEDRKAVLGLYNHAFEMKNGRGLVSKNHCFPKKKSSLTRQGKL